MTSLGFAALSLLALVGTCAALPAPTPAPSCGENPADIMFLLDESGSVQSTNFAKQLNFVKKFVSAFTIGPQAVQIGVVTFSNIYRNQFNLNAHHTQASLIAAISKIQYNSGNTHTGEAIHYIRTHSFTTAAGMRPHVVRILIVMTDGQSSDHAKTLSEAKLLHQDNIKTFAIGIGSGIHTDELRSIATDVHHVFTVSNFDKLDNQLQTELKKTACKVDGGWSKFGPWSSCSKTCAGGRQTQHRQCNSPPPAHGGAYCVGKNFASRGCHPEHCPVDGEWSKYGAWSTCTKTCGGGTHSRTRTCSNPAPAYGGANCTGSNTETQPCNTDHCTTPTPLPAGCGQTPADIVFLLDRSGSIGSANFVKQLDFVKRFADAFTIGPGAVQIGVVTFSTTPRNEFNLNHYRDKASLRAGISKIHYDGGSTHTAEGLNFVRMHSFTKAAGMRDKVVHILIVMTDGQSNDKAGTALEATKLHHLNYKTLAIGIGNGIHKDELNAIATDTNHVFTVTNFNALNTIETELKKTTCKVDGGWSNYGNWSSCTKTCEGGTHFHVRTCTNPPPSHGGANCVGPPREEKPCHTEACPTTPMPATTTHVTHPATTNAAGCSSLPADIVFILDSSGSVGPADFATMLQFVVNVTDEFNIGPTSTRVGLVTFADMPTLQFNLNTYSNKVAVLDAILKIPYHAGGTHTDTALKYAREVSFKTANGARSNAAKVAIVVTDGKSQNEPATIAEAERLRKSGITIFSIGVGSGPKLAELNAIATDPDNQHVFVVTDFSALDTIKVEVTQKTCNVKHTPTATTPPQTNITCTAEADIVFLLDSSGSVTAPNFQKMLQFVKDVSNTFDIGPTGVQIGVDTFQTHVKTEFDMDQYGDKQSLIGAVGRIKYTSGGTHTGEAIHYLNTHSFTNVTGMRDGVPHIGIVITDGKSANRPLTVTEATKAKANGITLLAVGVGVGANTQELKAIASDPDSQYMFQAASFDALKTLKSLLASQACVASKPNNISTATHFCGTAADIVFMVDDSGSIGHNNFKLVISFIQSIVKDLDVDHDKIRIGFEKFDSRVYNEFNLNQHPDKASTIHALDNVKYHGGGTNTGEALDFLRTTMFSFQNGDRANVPNIGIVITDGKSSNHGLTVQEAKKARDAGINIFAIGVGNGISMTELNDIATDPDNLHVMTVDHFDKLPQIKALFTERACTDIPATVPPYSQNVSHLTPSLLDPCQDTLPNCKNYPLTTCKEYPDWSLNNCKRYCHICTPIVTTTQVPCVDKIKNCKDYTYDSCSQYKPWAMESCMKYCGLCDPSAYVGGYGGMCHYKGGTYGQGAKWSDGCAYDCECTDASQGKYSCYNKCPTYYNLPPQCTLVKNGNDCCLRAVCDFKPSYSTTTGNGIGELHGVGTCVHDGKKYYQGQSWNIGCEYHCVCTNTTSGLWECQSMCPHYGTLPAPCKLVQEPGQCCRIPKCEFNSQYGSFSGIGITSGAGDVVTPTPPPPCIDILQNCAAYGAASCTEAGYRAWALSNCRKHCNLCHLPPGPGDVCVYESKQYHEGEKWTIGCKQECYCDDGKYGYYRCNELCPKISNLPVHCHLVKVDGDCCEKVKCDNGSFLSSQTIAGTIGGHPNTIPNNISPNTTGPTPVPHIQPNTTLDGCFYKGTLYIEGQRWQDGCEFACRCENGKQGKYKCTSQCPTFGPLPIGCAEHDDPNNPCCKAPQCSSSVHFTIVPQFGKGFTGYGPVTMPVIGPVTGQTVAPTLPSQTRHIVAPTIGHGGNGIGTRNVGGNVGGMISGTGTGVILSTQYPKGGFTGSGTGCYHKGKVYKPGEKWQDGCEFNCTCLTGKNGYYECLDRCQKYTNLPSSCTLEKPQGQCCAVPKCTHNLNNTGTCYYKSKTHKQGETWNDGCDYKCNCTNASTGSYKCQSRCPTWNLPPTCHLEPPAPGKCCHVPKCPDTIKIVYPDGYTPGE